MMDCIHIWDTCKWKRDASGNFGYNSQYSACNHNTMTNCTHTHTHTHTHTYTHTMIKTGAILQKNDPNGFALKNGGQSDLRCGKRV